MTIVQLADSAQQAGAISPTRIGIATTSHGTDDIVVTAVADKTGDLKLIAWRISNKGRTIARIGDSGAQAGKVVVLDAAFVTGDRLLTAVRTNSGVLRLIGWQLANASGNFTRLGENTEGPVLLIRALRSPQGGSPAGNRAIVGVCDGNAKLVLKHWEIKDDGSLHRVGDTALQNQPTGAASDLALGWTPKGIQTTVRASGDQLKLILWEGLAEGGLKRVGDSGTQGGDAKLVDTVSMGTIDGAGPYVVTPVVSGAHLKLISWKISPDGKSISRVSDSGQAAGSTDLLSCTGSVVASGSRFDPNFVPEHGRIVTAIRTRAGNLKLIVWHIASDGKITRVEDFDDPAEAIDQVSLVPLAHAANVYVAAIRDRSGHLKLHTWAVKPFRQKLLPDNIVLLDRAAFENTAQVVAPKAACPKGRIALLLGDPNDGLIRRDLLGATNEIATTAATTAHAYPVPERTQLPWTDNQIIRLQDGSLIAIKKGAMWSDATPRPEWFDKVDIGHFGGDGSSKRARNSVFVFRSTNFGQNWGFWSVIDTAVVAGGIFGWPQPTPGQITPWWNGGFDMTWLYQDPWTRDIYVSGKVDSGPFPKNDGTMSSQGGGAVLVSHDNGLTWPDAHLVKSNGTLLMTSTPRHPLIALSTGGPTLYFLAKGSKKLSEGFAVLVSEDGETVAMNTDGKSVGLGYRGLPGITRIGESGDRDRVRVAYPALEGEQQVYKVANVTFGGATPPSIELVTTIRSEEPLKRSCVGAAFIGNDRVDAMTANPDEAALLYWFETLPDLQNGPNAVAARYQVFYGAKGHTKPAHLSVRNGQPRYFAQQSMGHYVQSGCFVWNGKLHFLPQWVEQDGIKGNVVTIEP